MTHTEAEKMIDAWGKHLEYCHGPLFAVFSSRIPASLLPHRKQTMEDAINIFAKYHYDLGDYEASEFFKSTLGPLMFYCEDEEAVDRLFKKYPNPKMDSSNLMLDRLRAYAQRVQSSHS